MKTIILMMSFLFSLAAFSGEAIDLEKVKCTAIYIDHAKRVDAQIMLSKVDKGDIFFFEGEIDKNYYYVMIDKTSYLVDSLIERSDGVNLYFRGGFHDGEVKFFTTTVNSNEGVGIGCFVE